MKEIKPAILFFPQQKQFSQNFDQKNWREEINNKSYNHYGLDWFDSG